MSDIMEKNKNLSKKFTKILEKEGVLSLAKKMAKEHKGAEMYLVGGAVRDIIIGRPVGDMDILVRKIKISDLEKFLERFGAVDLVGKRFSVLKFTPKGGERQIDVALPRTDFAYGTGGYKDFKVKANPNLPIEEDLARRDFTINAMAWDIYNNKLIDPYGGLADLKKKIIRAVLRPEERFKEDYSRMLRAMRFAMQLDFEIEARTWSAIKRNIKKINEIAENGERKVPYEVIAAEFLKGLDARPAETIRKYLQCGAAAALMPELLAMKKCTQPKKFHSEGDVLEHTLIALHAIDSPMFKKYFGMPPTLTTKVAILLHDVGKPITKKKTEGRWHFLNHDKIGAEIAKKIIERLKFSAPPGFGVDAEAIVWMIYNHLLFLHSQPKIMKKTTLEKYLFNKRFSGEAFLQLFLADTSATHPYGAPTDFSRFKEAYGLWKGMMDKARPVLPKAILNGDEVMKILNLKPGIKVGEILQLLREEQLQGRVKDKKSAAHFIKNIKL